MKAYEGWSEMSNLSRHSCVFCREQSSNISYSQSVYVRNCPKRLALSDATVCSRGDLAIIGKPANCPFLRFFPATEMPPNFSDHEGGDVSSIALPYRPCIVSCSCTALNMASQSELREWCEASWKFSGVVKLREESIQSCASPDQSLDNWWYGEVDGDYLYRLIFDTFCLCNGCALLREIFANESSAKATVNNIPVLKQCLT